jgi:hypothetical protein
MTSADAGCPAAREFRPPDTAFTIYLGSRARGVGGEPEHLPRIGGRRDLAAEFLDEIARLLGYLYAIFESDAHMATGEV